MNIFLQIATTLLALLTGGMVLIAFGLVPYWRSLEPSEFTVAFSTSLPTVGGTMIILTVLSTPAIVAAAAIATWKKLPSRNLLIAGALAALIMLATVPLYFGTANSLLAGGTLSANEIADELVHWQKMHWFRTIMGVAGLFCVVRAGYQSLKN